MKILLSFLLLLGSVQAYTDTDNSPYADAIDDLSDRGWIQGYEDDTYRPEANINRAEFIKILLSTQLMTQVNYQAQSDQTCFPDVPANVWYRPYVCVAQDRNIIDGYADGRFVASNNVNKAEAGKILYQFYFDDPVGHTSPWYEAYYQALDQEDIKLNLWSEPADSPLTRGQMAFAIQQFERFPSHSLLPPSVKATSQLETPVIVQVPDPVSEPVQVVSPQTSSVEVSPLRVIAGNPPGPEVSGGYISSYKQWKRASFAPSVENHTLTDAQEDKLAEDVLISVNAARVEAGKSSMRYDTELQAVAQNFAEHLVINAIYSHSDMLGQDPFERAKAAGISGFVAESIVWRKRTPESAIDWWKNSQLHWNNVSNSRFVRAGVGVTKEPNGGYIVVLFQGE